MPRPGRRVRQPEGVNRNAQKPPSTSEGKWEMVAAWQWSSRLRRWLASSGWAALRSLLTVRDSSIALGGSPGTKVEGEGGFSVTLSSGPSSPLHPCSAPASVSVHDPAPSLSLPRGSQGNPRFSRLSAPAFCSPLVQSSGLVPGAVTTPLFLRWYRCFGAVGGRHPGCHPLGSIQAGSVGHWV